MRRLGLWICAALMLAALPTAGSSSSGRSLVGTKLASRLTQLRPSVDRVNVILEARHGRANAAAAAAVRAGAKVRARYHDLVQVAAPVASLERLASSSAIAFVRPPLLHAPASVTGQEVNAAHAPALHNAGVTGLDVKVAVIDIGFQGMQAAIDSGDLPQGTVLRPNGCLSAGGTSHGTAVAELVHDMAPAASLYLVCVDSEATLGTAVEWVLNQGIPIINHSITWLSGGRGDGVKNRIDRVSPDDIARKAYDAGVLWVGAAGNYAQSHWSGAWSDSDGDGYDNFSGGDNGNSFTIAARSTTCASLVWDDWPVSDQDFDLYLKKSGSSNVALASSATVQRPGRERPPSEEACYSNTTDQPVSAYIEIKRFAPATTQRFDLFITQGTLRYSVARGSVAQPAESPWVLAVGAVCWNGYGFRPYSSEGPTIDGRIKPDLAGYDSVSTRTFGASGSCTTGFMGTSAATPSVTGAAALLLQQRRDLAGNPSAFMAALTARTVDLGARGRDNAYGSGALCLSSCVAPNPPPPPPPPPPPAQPPPRLALTGFVTVPKHSKAGKPFTARVAVVRSDTGAKVTSGTVSCTAKVARARLRVRSAGFRRGLVTCSWRIPRASAKSVLHGSVGLAYRGLKIHRSFTQRIT